MFVLSLFFIFIAYLLYLPSELYPSFATKRAQLGNAFPTGRFEKVVSKRISNVFTMGTLLGTFGGSVLFIVLFAAGILAPGGFLFYGSALVHHVAVALFFLPKIGILLVTTVFFACAVFNQNTDDGNSRAALIAIRFASKIGLVVSINLIFIFLLLTIVMSVTSD